MSWDSVALWAPTFLLAAIGWLLRNALGRVTDRIRRIEDREPKTEEALNDTVNALGRLADRMERIEDRMSKAEETCVAKVDDEDWVRESMRLRNSVTNISNMLHRMEGKSDGILQIAQSMTQMGGAIEASAKQLALVTRNLQGASHE